MSPALQQRSPVAKAGWLVGVFIVGWLAFLFVPWPGRNRAPEPLPKMIVRPPSKLQAVGLPDNPDFIGLPEFFAVCASRAEWEDNRTRFAYWHPGAQDYSYYFEATRVAGGFRFRQIAELKEDEKHAFEQKSEGTDPIRFYLTLESPKPAASLIVPPDFKHG